MIEHMVIFWEKISGKCRYFNSCKLYKDFSDTCNTDADSCEIRLMRFEKGRRLDT
jgi:hypothetical protein